MCSEPACLEDLHFIAVTGTCLAVARTTYGAAIVHDTRSQDHLHVPASDWDAVSRPHRSNGGGPSLHDIMKVIRRSTEMNPPAVRELP